MCQAGHPCHEQGQSEKGEEGVFLAHKGRNCMLSPVWTAWEVAAMQEPALLHGHSHKLLSQLAVQNRVQLAYKRRRHILQQQWSMCVACCSEQR